MPYDIAVDIVDAEGKLIIPFKKNPKKVEEDNSPHIGALRKGNDGYSVVGVYETVDGKSVELKARKGLKVAVLVDGWPKWENNPHGHITDVLGVDGENDTEMHAILAEYGLPYRFEPDVENAADSISDKITKKDLQGRKDFRETLTFTIDPIDAKDFDDALSFKKLENGNYEVGVHIADVSYYVKPGDVVDKEAQQRGTSVYLVDRTVPMLPEKLSNKLCSLRPAEDKLTFSAVFEMTPKAEVVSRWFGRTIIDSNYRFAYETAQQIIDNGDASLEMELRGGTDGKGPNADAHKDSAMGTGVTEGCLIPRDVKEAVLTLWSLAEQMRKKRYSRGAIQFDRPEMKVEVDDKGKPIAVHQAVSKEANWLIEEFMLLANRSVAEFIATGGAMDGKARKDAKTFVYRIHDEPNMEKLSSLGRFVSTFGYRPDFSSNAAKGLNSLLSDAHDKPEFKAIELLALRSMAKARYSTDNIGHYGLAFKFYTHFTSPIRRYPDTMVHRLLAMYLDNAKSQDKDYYESQCVHCSEREVIAANAERDSIKYKLVEFMQDKIGQTFKGTISGLTEWGMYVEIEPTKIEGMVPLRDLRSDYYYFDEETYRLVGRHSGNVYKLGDEVTVRVKSTSLEQRLLDYELVEENLRDHPRGRNDRYEGADEDAIDGIVEDYERYEEHSRRSSKKKGFSSKKKAKSSTRKSK